MNDWLEWGEQMRTQQQNQSLPLVEKLQKLKTQKLAKLPE
jgi:hypothetical protein